MPKTYWRFGGLVILRVFFWVSVCLFNVNQEVIEHFAGCTDITTVSENRVGTRPAVPLRGSHDKYEILRFAQNDTRCLAAAC